MSRKHAASEVAGKERKLRVHDDEIPEVDVVRSEETFVENYGYALGWAGMADALLIVKKSDQLHHDIFDENPAPTPE